MKKPAIVGNSGLALGYSSKSGGLLPSKHRIGLQRRCVCAGVAIYRYRLFFNHWRLCRTSHTLRRLYPLQTSFSKVKGLSNIHLCFLLFPITYVIFWFTVWAFQSEKRIDSALTSMKAVTCSMIRRSSRFPVPFSSSHSLKHCLTPASPAPCLMPVIGAAYSKTAAKGRSGGQFFAPVPPLVARSQGIGRGWLLRLGRRLLFRL